MTNASHLPTADVVIVGAGLSGLMAAHTLISAGKSVVVLDKSVSPGGRLATRRIGAGKADHGAQFFTVRDAAFQAWVDRWLAEGRARVWSHGWSDGVQTQADGHPRYMYVDGMNEMAVWLAESLNVRVNVQVDRLVAADGGWTVTDTAGAVYHAPAVLLTPPVPQSLALLDRGGVVLPAETRASLDTVSYDRCVGLMMVVEGGNPLPAPGAIQRPQETVSWIADNAAKGLSATRILTLHTNAAYSLAHYDDADDVIAADLIAQVRPFIGDDAVIAQAQVKRWKYSAPVAVLPQRTLTATVAGAQIAFAGDAFGAPRVEGAALSGMAAGAALAG